MENKAKNFKNKNDFYILFMFISILSTYAIKEKILAFILLIYYFYLFVGNYII